MAVCNSVRVLLLNKINVFPRCSDEMSRYLYSNIFGLNSVVHSNCAIWPTGSSV